MLIADEGLDEGGQVDDIVCVHVFDVVEPVEEPKNPIGELESNSMSFPGVFLISEH